MSATQSLSDSVYTEIRPGDYILVTFSPGMEQWHMGVVLSTGRDSIDAHVFVGNVSRRMSGLWHVSDERVRNGDPSVYFRGVFKVIPNRADTMIRDLQRKVESLMEDVRVLESEVNRIKAVRREPSK